MNGVNDMGGMQCFGPVKPEANEPVFHARWEARVYAMFILMGPWRQRAGILVRHWIEKKVPPTDYLRMTYYERWLASVVGVALDAGLVTQQEVASGRMAAGSTPVSPPLTADKVVTMLATGSRADRLAVRQPRFAPGTIVRGKNMHPTGHTRLPRYVRGRLGTIERDHGSHVFPDSRARNEGENPQPLYTVRFTARELWGDAANPADSVHLELWEDYLDPV